MALYASVCDVIKSMARGCLAEEDFLADDYAAVAASRHLQAPNGTHFATLHGRKHRAKSSLANASEMQQVSDDSNASNVPSPAATSSFFATTSLFSRNVENLVTFQVSKSRQYGRKTNSIEDVLGLQLTMSTRRDYRVSVDFVTPMSDAEAKNLQVGALVLKINEISVRGLDLEQVEEILQHAIDSNRPEEVISLEFSQRIVEVNLDRNPFEMTKFPTPKGYHLPGVKEFVDQEDQDNTANGTKNHHHHHHRHELLIKSASKSHRELTGAGSHARERSRSMKHFWMSDRSAKTCYDCEQLFTFFRRKHHCRSCGQIFCSQCCARLPQSFGGPREDESITRLRKQLVCHTCHRQLREGLEIELAGGNAAGSASRDDTYPTAQTLLLMPPHIAEALEKSTVSDVAHYKRLDKAELFDKDDIGDDVKPLEHQEKARVATLFSLFPKVQIVTSVQQLTHKPRLERIDEGRITVASQRPRSSSLSLGLMRPKKSHEDEVSRSINRLKRSNSCSKIGNPSLHRWSEAEFKHFVEESNKDALLKSTYSQQGPPYSSYRRTASRRRPKAYSGAYGEIRFGDPPRRKPFREMASLEASESSKNAPAENDKAGKRLAGVLETVGLRDDAVDATRDAESRHRKEEAAKIMLEDARSRIEEKIFHVVESATHLARLPILEQHRWMQIIHMFSQRAALNISCQPDAGDSMDIMDYVPVKCLTGGRVQDSFFIDGVLLHKGLSRKGMRSDVDNPRILLVASELDYQRKKEAIASLESVAGQEVEYMHIVAEKIMTLHPDIVLFGGHVHRVAEELLFKNGIAVVKNVRLVDLQRIARSTGASLLTSYDHVDKMSAKGVIGTCKRYYVMISDEEPKSVRDLKLRRDSSGNFLAKEEPVIPARKKRPQRQNIVFDGGLSSKGCTICLRGASMDVLHEVLEALKRIIRSEYNMRLQRASLVETGFLPPQDEGERSLAEEWFAKHSTSLYVSLKSHSLSMRAALKETQTMCKFCKDNTRFNNISSLRVMGQSTRQSDAEATDIQPVSAPGCTCKNKSGQDMRELLLFSTCWSSLEGNKASQAEMMCIDFYSSNDMSLGQFLMKYCFSNDREIKNAFSSSKLSFSHDTGRVVICVKDLSDLKLAGLEKQTAAADLRDIAQRTLTRALRSDKVLLWLHDLESSICAPRYCRVPEDMWNYSFGKFLEDMFYGKALQIDVQRFPQLTGIRNSRDPNLTRYFSRNGRVVSIQCEPLEPVLHVALQPALWQDRIDLRRQISDTKELCALAHEVYMQTTTKLSSSMNDMVMPLHAKYSLRILRNEVEQWYSCYASKIEANPPVDVFATNAYFKDIFKHVAGWSLRITQAMHATVKPTIKQSDASPKSALPKAWFEQLAGAMEKETALGNSGVAMELPSVNMHLPLHQPVMEQAGNLENLARFARSLATGEVSMPTGYSNLSNEVTNTLNARPVDDHTLEDKEDVFGSQSMPGNDSWDGTMYVNNLAATSTVGSHSSRNALEAFRRSYLHEKKASEGWGYLAIPKQILAWHPSLPEGVENTVVLVNASQPTSVVAYSLCSKEYTAQLNASLKKEGIVLGGPVNAVNAMQRAKCSTVEDGMLSLLRSGRRSNVDHVFVDDNQFQSATRFNCKSYYAMQFHALRRLYYGGDRNYVESLCHCEQWNAAGGKSGAGFLKTQDQRFIAKVIPTIELQMFLSMAGEYFSYMAKTFEQNLSSMLSKVLGVYKVTISSESDQTMCIIVMENLLYGRQVNYCFDLKGKMEGRYRDAKTVEPGTVLWDRNLIEMAGGIPLPLQESAMSLLLSAFVNDTTFLASVQATDYSMLVGYDVHRQEVVACIIDYIHKYDFMKMVEHAGKRLIQDEREITVLNPKQYRRRFCRAMTKYFTTIPSRYTKVTKVKRNAMLTVIAEEEASGVAGMGSGSGSSQAEIVTSPITNPRATF